LLNNELDRVMGLAGAKNLKAIRDGDFLRPNDQQQDATKSL